MSSKADMFINYSYISNKNLHFFENELKKPQNLSKRPTLMLKPPFIWE
jgi:hypothetical protein